MLSRLLQTWLDGNEAKLDALASQIAAAKGYQLDQSVHEAIGHDDVLLYALFGHPFHICVSSRSANSDCLEGGSHGTHFPPAQADIPKHHFSSLTILSLLPLICTVEK